MPKNYTARVTNVTITVDLETVDQDCVLDPDRHEEMILRLIDDINKELKRQAPEIGIEIVNESFDEEDIEVFDENGDRV